MPPQKRRPDPARSGPLELCSGSSLKPRVRPANNNKQAVLLDRLDVLEQLSRWKLELQVKVYRQTVLLPLADDVRDLERVSLLLNWVRRQRP
jgi:hypothetical protein